MMTCTDAERIADLEEDNRRLRRLLDQRDAPGELRHRLRSTLALLRAVVRKSAGTERDLPSYVAQLEDRLVAITRAQSYADEHGQVKLWTLLVDELLHQGTSEGEKLQLSGPDIRLQPKAGQVFALAIHELAINAVEHGVLGAEDGRVDVSWCIIHTEPCQSLIFTWTEFGPALTGPTAQSGFGTEVLTHMLTYDLKARTEIELRAVGMRCTVHMPLPEQIGYVASNVIGQSTAASE